MRSLATLSMVTKLGHNSTWHFCQCADGFFAFGGCHRPLVKKFTTVKELRTLYKNYLSYGYKPSFVDEAFTRTVIISDPWESQLPLSEQLALDALVCS